MVTKLFNTLFGCKHHLSRVFTLAKLDSNNKLRKTMYRVCLDCGKEFPYCWHEMKIKEDYGNTKSQRGFSLGL